MAEYGPMYGSKATNFQAIVRGAEPIYHPTSGKQIGLEKELTAEFAVHNGTSVVEGPDGTTVEVADIHGNFFHLDLAAERNRWTDDQKDMVRTRLDYLCTLMPSEVWHIAAAMLTEPIPNWSGLSSARKLALAGELGIVGEALAFERQELSDADLVARLEKKLAAQVSEAEAESALTAA